MNKIETLLKELCPNGVEWESLGESCEIANSGRKPVKSSLRESGDIPYYGANNIQDYVNGFTHDGDYILIAEDGSASLENYSVQRVKGKFWANNHVHVIRGKDKVINGFLFHYFKYMNFSAYLTGGTRAKLTKGKLIEIKIPIPPLEIQEEIVKILDKFTDYVTELTTELTLRQKQYNYYRDKLYIFEGEKVDWKKLGEIATIQRGASPRPISKFLTENEDGVPWIKIGDTNVNSKFVENTNQKITKEGAKKSRLLKKGDFILSNSMSFGRPYILKINGAIHDGWASISDFEDSVISDYLYHYLVLNKTQQYWASKINSGSVSNLNSEIIKSLNVPIPSFEVQSKIVKFLDYFNELTSNLSEGLPKEIELRQKQYEYYRDKLLTFD